MSVNQLNQGTGYPSPSLRPIRKRLPQMGSRSARNRGLACSLYQGNIFVWFACALVIFYVLPIAYLIGSGEFSLQSEGTRSHLVSVLLYGGTYCISGFVYSVLSTRTRLPRFEGGLPTARTVRLVALLTVIGGAISLSVTAIYYALGGYKKWLLLGTDIDPWLFRIIGYDDTSRVLTAAHEICRRVILPFVLVARIGLHQLGCGVSRFATSVFIVTGIAAAVVNLDRGPIIQLMVLMAFSLAFYKRYSIAKLLSLVVVIAGLVGVVGATVTYLQYNQIEVTRSDITATIVPILRDRVLLDPARTAELYVYENGDLRRDPLYLRYARIGALIGRGYVGTEDSASVYVAPVGLIGDVMRNFGQAGILLVAFLHGLCFRFLSFGIVKLDLLIRVPVLFMSLVLIMYSFYSGIFSMGPFAIFVTICLIVFYFKPNLRWS